MNSYNPESISVDSSPEVGSVHGDHAIAPPARPFVRVEAGKTGFPLSSSNEAREQFRQFRAISVHHMLDAAFLGTVLRLCETVPFDPGVSDGPGHTSIEAPPQRCGRILNLALSRPALLRWVEEVTGCGPLQRIEGRVMQMLCRPGDEFGWHDDNVSEQGRRVALVVNLGTAAYEGGEFELRRKGGRTLVSMRHTEPGSALFFKVGPGLEHRVLPLTAGGPRRVFAGWAYAGERG